MNSTLKKCPREDDVLEVILYPQFCYTLGADEVTEDMLSEEIKKYNKEIEPFVKDYFWHRDNLTFKANTKQALQIRNIIDRTSKPSELDLIPHIYINLKFDEDIGDEWFTVFLIFHLTKKFEGLIARVTDYDGEFLLIEAADELPSWVTPETCQNRVFVMNNAIHVVRDHQNVQYNILNNVYQRSHIFRMSEKVQNIIYKRISVYPEEIKKREHKARAYLPEKAACILKKEPQLAAAAIRTICHSDPWERKVCRAMRYFPPEQRQMANVRMTKCLYAMSTHCRYTGDPKTGWNLPPLSSQKYGAYLLGVKLACGLELLIAKANERKSKKSKDEANVDESIEIFEGPSWMKFHKRLESTGYFKGMFEESKEYQDLLQNAKKYYMNNLKEETVGSSGDFNFGEAEKVLHIWNEISSYDLETEVVDDSGLSPEDSTGWLHVDPEAFDAMLEQKFNFEGISKDSSRPLGTSEKVQAFLNQKSDIDGVNFYCNQRKESKSEIDDGQIEFDVEVFENTIKGILDLVVPGEDGEFDGSSEDSFGEDEAGSEEMEEYMRIMDNQLQKQLVKHKAENSFDSVNDPELNLRESMIEEAGGSGPVGNILGGPIERLKHLNFENKAGEKSNESSLKR